MNLRQLTYNYSNFRVLKSLYIVFLVSPNTLYRNWRDSINYIGLMVKY